ncbi:general odorant-binding protein 67-like [Ochlerotatus camptorhynchus]|uniref:general odorant-binding protein 67-like n=1 Tax=Ochlerotatus camptorhynchus TaxID=644619 RepID=UPI0031DFD8D0
MKFNLVLLTVIALVAMACSQQQISPECFNRPNNKHPKECCAAPNIMPSREQFTTCMQKFPKPDGPPTPGSPPPGLNCMAQCMLEQLGMMTNGVLSKDAATSKLVSLVGSSSDWQTVAKTTVDTCYQNVASMVSNKDSLGCSAAASPFIECLPTTMFTDCPASVWNPSNECTQLKAHLLKGCPIMTLLGPPQP